MSPRAKLYWSMVSLAVALFLALVIVGGVGVARDDRHLMTAMTLLMLAEFVTVAVIMVIRRSLTSPHPR